MRSAFLGSLISAGVLAAVVAVSACSGDGEGTASGAAATTGCAADTRKDVYTAGLTKTAGNLSVRIVDASPAPPAKGTNAMTLELVDTAGKPVDGATLIITPFMPDHGHGSAILPVVTPGGNGRYAVSKVYFAMAGLWRVTVSVQTPGSAQQEAVFQFCLDG